MVKILDDRLALLLIGLGSIGMLLILAPLLNTSVNLFPGIDEPDLTSKHIDEPLFLFPYNIIILAVIFGFGLLDIIRREIKERIAFARAIKRNPTRVQIHNCFVGFASRRYRLKYVRWLEANCERAPKDAWPEGHPPNINSDDASIELAKLDERWLGLDH